MTGDSFRNARLGRYPAVIREGSGVPLLLCHSHAVAKARSLVAAHAVDGRPLALIGAMDMRYFVSSPADVVRDLLDATGWGNEARIDVVGCSAGGHTALLSGALLSLALPAAVVSITVVSPIVAMWPPLGGIRAPKHEMILARIETRGKKARAHLHRYGDAAAWIAKAAAAAEGRFSVNVLYPTPNERDVAQAMLLAGIPGVELFGAPIKNHRLLPLFAPPQSDNHLIQILQKRLSDMPEDTRSQEAVRLAGAVLALRRTYPQITELLEAGDAPMQITPSSPALPLPGA